MPLILSFGVVLTDNLFKLDLILCSPYHHMGLPLALDSLLVSLQAEEVAGVVLFPALDSLLVFQQMERVAGMD